VADPVVQVHAEALHGHDLVSVLLDQNVRDRHQTVLLVIVALLRDFVQTVGGVDLPVRSREVDAHEQVEVEPLLELVEPVYLGFDAEVGELHALFGILLEVVLELPCGQLFDRKNQLVLLVVLVAAGVVHQLELDLPLFVAVGKGLRVDLDRLELLRGRVNLAALRLLDSDPLVVLQHFLEVQLRPEFAFKHAQEASDFLQVFH